MEIRRVGVETIFNLRHAVLREGLPRETARFEGDEASETVHLAAIEAGQVIGCVTLLRRPLEGEPAWQLRGMAVTPGRQGGGVGAALLGALDRHLRDAGDARPVWCNARVPAVRFYERHGWRAVSDVFEVPTAGPHRRLVWAERGRAGGADEAPSNP